MDVFKSIDPYTGKQTAEYPILGEKETERLIEKSEQCFHEYRHISAGQRKLLLAKLGDLMLANKEKLAAVMTSEMGKPVVQAQAEIEKCAKLCAYYTEAGPEILSGRPVPANNAKAFVRYAPIGGLLMIMPWNFPFWQVLRVAAPNILLGNTLLLKHAPNVQGCAREISKLFEQAGFPAGYFTHLPVEVPAVEKIINHSFVQGVTLTGSTHAGSAVASLAGKAVKKSVLELGGSNPFIVLDDADLEAAVDGALKGRMQNTGQSCIAAKRFIVTRKNSSAFTEALAEKIKNLKVQNPGLKETYIGPMARTDLAEGLFDQYKRSLKAGAREIVACRQEKAHFQPGLIADVTPGMPAFDEETFGPLGVITTVADKEEALTAAGRTSYGLGASVYTRNPREHLDVIDRLHDGAVFFNDFVKSDPKLPFGGTKQSGYGRELSREGLLEFANVKTVRIVSG